jgi:putative transcriptional regulator
MGKTKMKLRISNNIHILRAEEKITQEQLANAIEVTRATINAIEKEHYNPSLELAFRVARFFKKDVTEVFKVEGSYEKN